MESLSLVSGFVVTVAMTFAFFKDENVGLLDEEILRPKDVLPKDVV
jgi:hypothetical protein